MFKKLIPVIALALIAGPVFAADPAPASASAAAKSSSHKSSSSKHHSKSTTQSRRPAQRDRACQVRQTVDLKEPRPQWRGSFFIARGRAAGLAGFAQRVQILSMDGSQQAAIHQALVEVQHAVTSMTFPSCDQEDLIEAIDRVEEEMHTTHPNLAVMCRFLNSIARSLRAQPEAREACLAIEDAIGKAGMPSTWQSGI